MNNTGARDALIEQIKKSDNILVALSANPTIDELTAALGLTLILNKTNDHVTTIFSGQVPSVLNFLEPNKFFDKTVDGLRDFIIALNPDKADRVRTKVVDGMVRVSITPSKGAVTVDDLEFSQGDYNVDLVIALGVENQADLDKALEAHGRILHSAFVASIGVGSAMTDLGNLNWQEPALQSYAQIVADLSLNLDPKLDEAGQPVDTVLIDSSVATALMTGLVSITERFSNNLTTPEIMSLAAVLMGQGANQQLIAKELDEPNKIAALKQTLNQQNQAKTEASEAPVKPEAVAPVEPPKPENKLEHEAVINHKEEISMVEAKADDISQVGEVGANPLPVAPTEPKASQPETESEPLVPVEPTVPPRGIYSGKHSHKTEQSAVDLNQLIDKMVQNAQSKTELAPVEPPVVAPVEAVAEPTLGEVTQPVVTTEPDKVAEQKTNSTRTKDESWDKVNQFKQAFLDKMSQNKNQAEQARQVGLDEIKQSEPPEPPKAIKPPIEVAEPQPQSAAPSVAPKAAGLVKEEQSEAAVESDNAGDFIEMPVDLPRREQVDESKALSGSLKRLKTNIKKKPTKVIRPLAKQPDAGPTLNERIEQELNPVAPPAMPPLPAGLDLPPPLPPMPPALDQLTMTSLPPVEASLNNNPFDALEKPVAPPAPPIMPTMPTPPAAPAPKPNLDAQLTPQEAQAIGLNQTPPVLKAPVPENQFVIPE